MLDIGDAFFREIKEVGKIENDLLTLSANLSEVVRYDADIAHVSEQRRIHSFFNKNLYPFQTTQDETIICLKRDDWYYSCCFL